MSIYGQIRSPIEVEDALLEHCQLWLPHYVQEVGRQHSREIRNPVRYEAYDTDPTTRGNGKFPICVVEAKGLENVEYRGELAGWTSCQIGVINMANGSANIRRLSNLYNAAIRASLRQHPGLGGVAQGLVIEAEDVMVQVGDEAQNNQDYGWSVVRFKVLIDELDDENAGPLAPPEDPSTDPGNWPTVETVSIELEGRPINQPL